MHDMSRYLERLGLSSGAGFVDMHRAHAHSIPFENLDSYLGEHVPLDLGSLERKLVVERRGGYCFEQNLLFRAACEERGAKVETYLARVRWRTSKETPRPRAHLVLGVTTEGETWLADVGFGAGTPLEPMPFGPGGPFEQSGWTYQIVEERDERVLQRLDGDTWGDVYSFSPVPNPFVDIEMSNWYVSTHPKSPFVRGIMVSHRPADGSVETLSNMSGSLELTTEVPSGQASTPVDMDEVPELLALRFGLHGFELNAEGHLAIAH